MVTITFEAENTDLSKLKSLLKKFDVKNLTVNKSISDIPEEFRCDPYEISPSGDTYFADKRNVEELNKRIKEAHNQKARGELIPVNMDNLWENM